MKRTAIALSLAALLTSAAVAGDLKPADLVGGYTIVSGEEYGKEVADEKVKGTTVRFTEDAVIVTDKDKTDVYASAYKLDSSGDKCKITLISKLAPSEGQISHGLIEKDGDTVRLIYALPGGEPPTEFKTRDKQLLFVMKNMNK